jgi:hypothetical protein
MFRIVLRKEAIIFPSPFNGLICHSISCLLWGRGSIFIICCFKFVLQRVKCYFNFLWIKFTIPYFVNNWRSVTIVRLLLKKSSVLTETPNKTNRRASWTFTFEFCPSSFLRTLFHSPYVSAAVLISASSLLHHPSCTTPLIHISIPPWISRSRVLEPRQFKIEPFMYFMFSKTLNLYVRAAW